VALNAALLADNGTVELVTGVEYGDAGPSLPFCSGDSMPFAADFCAPTGVGTSFTCNILGFYIFFLVFYFVMGFFLGVRCGINYNRVCSRAGNGERCCVAGMPGKSHRAIGHVQLALRPAKKRKRFSLQNVVVKKLSFFFVFS